MASPYSVCVIVPNKPSHSETFIRSHLERLPGRIQMLYGFPFPTHTADDKRFLPAALLVLEKAKLWLPCQIISAHEDIKARLLAKFLHSNSIDVVLAEYGPTGASVMQGCIRSKTPFVVHFFGFDAHETATVETYRSAYRVMFEHASAIIAVSHEMERALIELGAPPTKVHYVPCGADCALFNMARPGDAPARFLAAGRFVEKKAPHLTLRAFHKVVLRIPKAQLVLIGDGPLFDACKQIASELNIEANVDFRGRREHKELAETMGGCRAFVQHSVKTASGDSEGTPVAILEAGASGLPVVSTRHAGIKDVVVEGETGFLVDEGDIASMADCMIRLAENPSLAASMGARARKHISMNFSLNASITRLSTILEESIKRARHQ